MEINQRPGYLVATLEAQKIVKLNGQSLSLDDGREVVVL
jgi:hypothetical protein